MRHRDSLLPSGIEAVFLRGLRPLVLRGAIALAFAALLLAWRAIPLSRLALLFGAYALVDGLISVAMVAPRPEHRHAWLLVVEGFAGIGIGLAALLQREVSMPVLVNLIGFWAVAIGTFQILLLMAAISVRQETLGALMLAMNGGTSMVLGLALLWWPEAVGRMLVLLLGCYELVSGVSTLSLALAAGRRPLLHRPS